MFEIEHNIPLPTRHRQSKYPWQQMDVESSFFVPVEPGEDTAAQGNRISTGASRAGVRLGWRFATATIRDDNGHITGWRVWRAA